METAKSSATGNSNPIEFTGIPDDAQEITLMFNGVSLNGSNEYLVQLGTVDGYVETGYASMSQDEGGTNPSDSTEGFIILGTASHELRGKFDITKFSDTAYTFEGQARKTTTGGLQAYGSLNNVNGTITKLRIKPTGNNNFDAGSINISYKTASSGSGGSGDGFVTGMIMMFSGTTAPSGWVLCDNSAEAQAANAPDLRDRFIVGASIGGNTTYPGVGIGSTGGSADATLPSHTHTIDYYAGDDESGNPARLTPYRQLEADTSSSGTLSTNSQGSSATNANLPPYYALAFIMKT